MDTSSQPEHGDPRGQYQPEPRGDSSNDTRLSSLVSYDSRNASGPEESGFAYIDGEVGGSGYNETKVDLVTVPCPGADPLRPWIGSDPFPDGYFSPPLDTEELNMHPALKELAGDAILSPGINMNLPKAAHVWVRQGIRKSASTARVLLYRHRTPSEGVTLESLADDLIDHVMKMREGLVGHPLRGPHVQLPANVDSTLLGHCSLLHTVLADWSSRYYC
jgi:hypothetical protein